MSDNVQALVLALLGGGLVASVATLITSKAVARKTGAETKALAAKLPAEVDSIAVQGAEAAVLTMKAALDSATARIGQLEDERETDRKRIAGLERRVEDLRRKVESAERALGTARQEGEAIRAELEQFVAEQSRRP